jgi:protein-S-isoprenylcysteine O-methyltransferase Ste14
MSPTDLSARRMGSVLVALQFGTLSVLGLLALPAMRTGQVPTAAWLLIGFGGGLGVWAVSCNRPGNFNIRPSPREGGQLVESGPYRWIRHPMYTAVIACGMALVLTTPTIWGGFAFILLVVVLATKARLEERWMQERHPAYAAYVGRTHRFLPWIV